MDTYFPLNWSTRCPCRTALPAQHQPHPVAIPRYPTGETWTCPVGALAANCSAATRDRRSHRL